jgi:hypothetical protein
MLQGFDGVQGLSPKVSCDLRDQHSANYPANRYDFRPIDPVLESSFQALNG